MVSLHFEGAHPSDLLMLGRRVLLDPLAQSALLPALRSLETWKRPPNRVPRTQGEHLCPLGVKAILLTPFLPREGPRSCRSVPSLDYRASTIQGRGQSEPSGLGVLRSEGGGWAQDLSNRGEMGGGVREGRDLRDHHVGPGEA